MSIKKEHTAEMCESNATATDYLDWVDYLHTTLSEGLSEQERVNWSVEFAHKLETIMHYEAFYHRFMVNILEMALPFGEDDYLNAMIHLHSNWQKATLSNQTLAWAAEAIPKAVANAIGNDAWPKIRDCFLSLDVE